MHPLAIGYRTLGRVARTLPRPMAYAAARQLMSGVYHAWPRGRRAAQSNASKLLPHVDWQGTAGDLAKAQFQRYGEYLVDAVRLDELSPADCYRAVGGEGGAWDEHWRQLSEWYNRRPILFAVIHYGNWDILGGAFTHRVGKSMVLVDDLGNRALNQAIQHQRARLGMQPATGRAGLRQVIQHLENNGTAAILFDRPPRDGEQSHEEEIFGERVKLPTEIHRIANRTKAKLVPLAAARTGSNLEFQPHITLDYKEGAPLLTAFEPALKQSPDQWYHFRPLFD